VNFEHMREERSSRTRRPAFEEYYDRALHYSPRRHTPHLLDEAFTFLGNWKANKETSKTQGARGQF
jgi:hypothetical protein